MSLSPPSREPPDRTAGLASPDGEDPRPASRADAVFRVLSVVDTIHAVADRLEICVGVLDETAIGREEQVVSRSVADAATNLRLTASALDYIVR